MTDASLIELYMARSESAISETAKQYGAFCRTISMRILHNAQDADECVNDAYLNVWNAIPPEKPRVFSSFLAKIVKNLSLNRYRAGKTQKRGEGEISLVLSELEECVPSAANVENEVDAKILAQIIEQFLSTIPESNEIIFLRRYWHNDSVAEIAKRFNISQAMVKSSLFRTRNELKAHLKQKGGYYE
jgi:RNA polymerase sigma-70 factor (ECF subfamily)